MKLAFIADAHVANHHRFGGAMRGGLNDRARLCFDTLARAVDCCEERGVDALFVCGDLFDSVRPEPQVIAAVANIMAHRSHDTYLLRGNHEMQSDEPGDHSLGPLGSLGMTIIEEPKTIRLSTRVEVFAVPFFPGSHAEKLPGILKSLAVQGGQRGSSTPASSLRLLALHSGISDDQTEPWLARSPDSLAARALFALMKEHGIEGAFAGHWHKGGAWFDVTRSIAQIGALCPRGWNDPGADGYGAVVVYDTEAGSTTRITRREIPGPRFFDAPAPPVEQGYTPFVREPAPSRVEAEVAARSAAMVARSADTLAEALAAFVNEMPLPEGVSREAVLERAKRYLEA